MSANIYPKDFTYFHNKLPSKSFLEGTFFRWSIYSYEYQTKNQHKLKYYMMQELDSVRVLALTKNNKVILARETKGDREFLGLPGGYCDIETKKDEDILKEGLRELSEETGYSSDINNTEVWFSIQKLPTIDSLKHNIIARNCELKSAQKLDIGEDIQVELVSLDKFIDLMVGRKIHAPDLLLEMMMNYYHNQNSWDNFKSFLKA